MNDHRMKGVQRIFDKELPVAGMFITQHTARDFNLPCRCAVDEVVQRTHKRTQPIGEAGTVSGSPRENEAAIVAGRCNLSQREVISACANYSAVIASSGWNAAQRTIEPVYPTVVRASKGLGSFPAAIRDDLRSFVQAPIEEDASFSVVTANQHYGMTPDARGEEIAGSGDLAFVAYVDPGALKKCA